jgi:GT2 family glycosyltransferase
MIGIVAIGRNEGERLKACLQSLALTSCPIVYVDSGSTDGSVEFAKSLDIDVIELDMTHPFTMSRGRNAGWRQLLDRYPETAYIQFIDGDCVMQKYWLSHAILELDRNKSLGAVSGRRREKSPEKSIYNLLADMEWNTPTGNVLAVPGDMMVRRDALTEVDGFDETVIAAEDDEICNRLRIRGWGIARIAAEMSLHDMNMTSFSQWWRRSIRSGHGFAQVNSMHGRKPLYYFRREVYRSLIWGIIIPFLAIVFAYATSGISLLVALSFYAASLIRTCLWRYRRGDSLYASFLYAAFATLSKFAACIGMAKFWKRKFFRDGVALIEYKAPVRT